MGERRVVYFCPTLLSLMNSIVTQLTVNKGTPADIVFEDATDFTEISERLMRCKVFEECYTFYAKAAKEKYHSLGSAEKQDIDRHPSKLFSFPPFKHKYTDFCTHIDSYASKFFYYGLLEQGMEPVIHFVSEGTGTYALDFANTARDHMDHEYYGEKAFLKKVKNIYLYRPELYTGGAKFVNLVQLPSYAFLEPSVHQIIEDVFGKTEPVEQKLIYFEGVFWGDGHLVNEMELFLAIANYIGKDNVVVKRHPRNIVDRFTPLGFHVMPQQSVPWEVMIKDLDLSRKALVSVASFTAFSALEMYGRISRSILLEDLMFGKAAFLQDAGYRRFFQKAEKIFNHDEIVSWRPTSMKELQVVLDVIGDKIGGWQK